VGLVGVVALSAAATEPASAHADLIAACPGIGEVMSEVTQIELGFSGPMLVRSDTPASIIVRDADGGVLAEIAPILASPTVVRAASPSLVRGSYEISYEVFSFDGDLNTGSYRFEVAAEELATDCAADAQAEPASRAPWALIGLATATISVVAVLGWLLIRRRPPTDPDARAR
jgi:methionine-rich copper-binding protein CopC